MNKYIYLASPYSHPCPAVRVARFEVACRMAARLMDAGAVIFCPIAHSHAIAEVTGKKHMNHEFWMRQDLPLLEHASGLIVLQLDGWLDSKGVNEEIEFALKHQIPVKYIHSCD